MSTEPIAQPAAAVLAAADPPCPEGEPEPVPGRCADGAGCGPPRQAAGVPLPASAPDRARRACRPAEEDSDRQAARAAAAAAAAARTGTATAAEAPAAMTGAAAEALAGAAAQPHGLPPLPERDRNDTVDTAEERRRAPDTASTTLGGLGQVTPTDYRIPAGHPGDTEPGGRQPRPGGSRQFDGETERLRYVGAATRRIARGIDLDEILLGLCRSVVPAFADAILVYLRDPLPVGDEQPTGPLVLRLRRSDRLPDEGTELTAAETGALLPVVPSTEGEYGSAAESFEVPMDGALAGVLRGVRPVFAESAQASAALSELLLGGPGPDGPGGAGQGRGGQPLVLPSGRRAIMAPLRGRRRVTGTAVLLRGPERPPFEADDLLVAAQLATHTALGVDKALLYGREAYIADSLQREMLPESLPQPTGVRLASRYLPAAESVRVGGDWYDAIPLPGGRVALVVGDVMGHSMTSAAVMGQLRTTVQTLAGLDLSPQEVLYHLDEQAQRLGQDRMATCVYAVYDPIAHRVTIANAGHPPPVLLHPNGFAEVLRVPPGAPIGVGGVPFEAVELPAPAGATLLLYTDGLVESRTRDVWCGIETLRERLLAASGAECPPPLEPLCDAVLEVLGPGDRDDDIALLAARFDGIAPRDVAYWFLEPRVQTPGRARRLVRHALLRWGLEPLVEAVELLVSEVVTNAVRYAERPVSVRLLRTDVLRCEVGDDAPTLPLMRHPRPQDEDGRGLYLVSRMAQRWGATRLGSGKVVWFELALPGAPGVPAPASAAGGPGGTGGAGGGPGGAGGAGGARQEAGTPKG